LQSVFEYNIVTIANYIIGENEMTKKGENITEEVKEKIRLTRRVKMLSKFKWKIIEPYLDEVIDIGSRNRNKKFITFREFKKLIEEGNSQKSIKQMGISKHLIQFYSNFSQGKIDIDKDTFSKEYNDGLSLDEIALKYKVTREDITYLRQLYGQKNKGATYINRKKIEVPLTQRQKDILYGSMMGDAYKMTSSSSIFKHSSNQEDYLFWKYSEFKNIASEHSLQKTMKIDKRSETEVSTWRFYTYANSDIEKCIFEFYNTGKKEVSLEILNRLTPLSIAVWYQDDGTTDFEHRKIVRNGIDKTPIFTFCTESFSLESCRNIVKWFKSRYNIITYLKETQLSDRMGHRIRVHKDSADSFAEMIKPHILPMFSYKVDYDAYKENRKNKQIRVIGADLLECPLGVDFSVLDVKHQQEYIDNLVLFYQHRGIESLVDKPYGWENHMNAVFSNNPENLIKEDYISFSNLGNNFLMSHFPNFWSAKSKGSFSPREVFENKEYLSDIIRKIVVQGYFPSSAKILKALKRYRGNKRVSGFMPCVAKAIYHKYCDKESRVLDFCAGYGGRMFGAVSCDKVISYTGIEVNFPTYSGLQDLYNTLRIHAGTKKEVIILNQDSILGMKQFANNAFDFCFTSPPYYDAEIYSDDEGQSFKKHLRYDEWFNNYLIGAIREAMRVSKRVVINMANTGGYMIADDLENWLKSEEMNYNIDNIRLPHYGGDFKFEPIFVF